MQFIHHVLDGELGLHKLAAACAKPGAERRVEAGLFESALQLLRVAHG